MADQPISQIRCWICGKDVWLRNCKIDEHGHAVHEGCYAVRMKLQSESVPISNKARTA